MCLASSFPLKLTTSSGQISYDILSVYGQIPTPGLIDNMVYDVIPLIPAAMGNATVNASIYEVDCGYPQSTQVDPTDLDLGLTFNTPLNTPNDSLITSFELPCT